MSLSILLGKYCGIAARLQDSASQEQKIHGQTGKEFVHLLKIERNEATVHVFFRRTTRLAF